MHADLLEHDRRRRSHRTALWCGAALAAAASSGWYLQHPVAAYLRGKAVMATGARAAERSPRLRPAVGQHDGGEARAVTGGTSEGANGGVHEGLPGAAIAPAVSEVSALRPRPTAPGVQTRPLSAWLTEVASEADRDLVISPELHGELTATVGGRLVWQQRLEAFARVFGFDFAVGDGLIEVRPRASARPSGSALGDQQAGSWGAGDDRGRGAAAAQGSATSASEASSLAAVPVPAIGAAELVEKPAAPIETRVAPLAHAPAKEMAAVLAKAAEPLGVSVVPELSSNALVVSGTRASTDRAFALLRELDRPRRRVLLEAKIVELTHSARLDLGVDWKLTGDLGADVKLPPPLSPTGSAALVLATGGAYALDARISAMEAKGRVRVVSRPSVVMLEGSPATVESVRILRIRLPSRGTVVGDDVVQVDNGQRATEEIPVGVRLEVTPAVRAGRRVLLRIKAKSSSLGAPLPPDDIPEELSRMVDAELLVADGETAVLGGLLRESGQRSGAGVPVLREVPVLGALFGRRSREREEEELLVMVTPRVLD